MSAQEVEKLEGKLKSCTDWVGTLLLQVSKQKEALRLTTDALREDYLVMEKVREVLR